MLCLLQSIFCYALSDYMAKRDTRKRFKKLASEIRLLAVQYPEYENMLRHLANKAEEK